MVAGFLSIDKPIDLTSHDVIQHVRRVFGIRQVGHTGTLDPFATGLLIILLGSATRLTQYLHALPKTYVATITLGTTSDTDDLTGELTTVAISKEPTLDDVQRVLQTFLGKQQQIPPIYSALKTGGEKLYTLARQGKTKEALHIAGEKKRIVEVYSIDLLQYRYPLLEIRVRCSSGTYIRSLARDIGVALNTGGYVSTLRRTEIGHLKIDQAKSLNDLRQGIEKTPLQPLEQLLQFLPSLSFSADNVVKLKQGRTLIGEQAVQNNEPVVLLDDHYKLFGIGIYNAIDKVLSPHTILF